MTTGRLPRCARTLHETGTWVKTILSMSVLTTDSTGSIPIRASKAQTVALCACGPSAQILKPIGQQEDTCVNFLTRHCADRRSCAQRQPEVNGSRIPAKARLVRLKESKIQKWLRKLEQMRLSRPRANCRVQWNPLVLDRSLQPRSKRCHARDLCRSSVCVWSECAV